MTGELKGFKNSAGEKLGRKEPISTKYGMILYKGRGDDWKIMYPDGSYHYGGMTTIRLMTLIYYLNQTKGNLDKSLKLAGFNE